MFYKYIKKALCRELFENLYKDDVIRTFANILINELRYPTKENIFLLEMIKILKK